ncbi:MAG: FAD-dependent monooxygenase, partial [Paracoccaceae bacterium]
ALVVAADGRNSPMRMAAGIEVTTTRFGQKALVFAVTHPSPHDNVSTEIHRSGGPFTLVPLPDLDGKPCSAVVWMEDGPEARRLQQLDRAAFEAEATTRSAEMFGPLTLASRRILWPIISQLAERLTGQRIALLAEAAHVLPPIGAQGLNMSLADLRCLRDLAVARPDGLGDAAMLDAYHKARMGDMRARVAGISLLNRASQAGTRPTQDLRAAGIGALYALPPVRHMLMRMGLGVT